MNTTIKYVVFPGRTEYSKAIFKDLKNESSVMLESELNNKMLKMINLLHTSCKSNHYFRIPFQNIWYKKYINYNLIRTDAQILFLFCEENRLCYDVNYLTYLRSKYQNCKIVFFPVNSMANIQQKYHELIINEYDNVVTFDNKNAEDYGWLYYGRVLSTINLDKESCLYDIIYIGSNSGRLETIHSIYRYLKNNNVKCLFYINEVDTQEQIKADDIIYNTPLTYNEILLLDSKSNCILEVLREGQYGGTLRMAEAVMLGRKLLTNNKNSYFEKSYSKESVQIFTNINEIDINFIKDKHHIGSPKLQSQLAPINMLKYVYESVFSL